MKVSIKIFKIYKIFLKKVQLKPKTHLYLKKKEEVISEVCLDLDQDLILENNYNFRTFNTVVKQKINNNNIK